MKLLILIMKAHHERFIIQADKVKFAFQKQIDKYNLGNNISIIDYIGSYTNNYNKNTYIKDNTIYCKSGDGENSTYFKTLDALEYINENIEYDYIFRTNTSTFINIKLLYEFIKYIDKAKFYYNKDIFFSSVLISLNETYAPRKGDIVSQGKGLLFNKYLVNKLLNNKWESIDNEYDYSGIYFAKDRNKFFYTDDTQISTVFNILHLRNNENIIDYLYTFNHLVMYDIIKNTNKNNFEFLKNFITICFKNNDDQHNNKLEEIDELTNIFITNSLTDIEIDTIIKNNLLVNNHAPVFMGFNKNEQYKFIIRNNLYE